jgi:hypothetical protein
LSLKPNVAYLVLNFCALWKKQTTLPPLAYAGIPYQVLGDSAGALALMIVWSRSAVARSGCGISAIFASTSLFLIGLVTCLAGSTRPFDTGWPHASQRQRLAGPSAGARFQLKFRLSSSSIHAERSCSRWVGSGPQHMRENAKEHEC